jgi:predicted RNA-binding protein YlxR (DUF448 family)
VKPRHVPMRTCAGCRQGRPKREMVRIVRSPEGTVSVDLTGKRSGRGTYVCPRLECWDKALRTGSLAHVLKTEIATEDVAELRRIAATYSPNGKGKESESLRSM